MKKNRILPIVVLILLGILAGGFYFSPKKFAGRVNPDDIDHFTVFNGRTGTSFQVEDPVYIKMIVRNLQTTSLKRSGIFVKDYAHMGYDFSIEGIDQNGRSLIPILFIKDTSTILKRPFIYTCGGELCADFLKELEAEQDILTDMEENTEEPTGARMEICIDNIYYSNTEIAVPIEPDESAVEYVEIPAGGSSAIEAFAKIQDDKENYLVCLIDGEWYKFLPK